MLTFEKIERQIPQIFTTLITSTLVDMPASSMWFPHLH